MAGLLLGIHLATDALRTTICTNRGEVIATAESKIAAVSSPHGWLEHEPSSWWRALREAVPEAIEQTQEPADAIRAIGLAGHAASMVLLGREALVSAGDRVPSLRPAIVGDADPTRTTPPLVNDVAPSAFWATTGRESSAALQRLLWVREHEPDAWTRLAMLAMPKDYLRLRLTSSMATDHGDACNTGLYNVVERRWDLQIAAACGIDVACLPRLCEPAEVAGVLTPGAAAALGLPEGIPVATGTGEVQADAIAAGVVEADAVAVRLSDDAAVFAYSDESARANAVLHTGVSISCGATGQARWLGHAHTACGLAAVKAVQRLAGSNAKQQDFAMRAADLANASEGPELFVPHVDSCGNVQQTLFGMHGETDCNRITAAAAEGVACHVASLCDAVTAADGLTPARPRTIRVFGSAMQSAGWLQLVANALGIGCVRVETPVTPAFGAALLAGVAAGVWPTVRAAARSSVVVSDAIDAEPIASARLAKHRQRQTLLINALDSIEESERY